MNNECIVNKTEVEIRETEEQRIQRINEQMEIFNKRVEELKTKTKIKNLKF